MRLTFKLNTDALDKKLAELVEGGPIRAHIYNDAKSADGTYYWVYVNDGRGPIRPVKAKVLHWVDAQGKDIFAMYAKGVPPTHIRENSLVAVREVFEGVSLNGLDRASMARVVNDIAQTLVTEMESRTPVRTGKLKASYRVELAEGGEE